MPYDLQPRDTRIAKVLRDAQRGHALVLDACIDVLANSAECLTCGAQTELQADGGEPECCFVVVSGELVVVRRFPGTYPAVQIATAGDIVVLLQNGRQTTTCFAVRDSTVLRTDRSSLTRLARSNPQLMCALSAANDADDGN